MNASIKVGKTILEHSPIGTTVDDLSKRHTADASYVFTAGNNPARFSIDSAGMLAVASTDLDREMENTVKFDVTIYTALQTLVIQYTISLRDINDNAATFDPSSYTVALDEDVDVRKISQVKPAQERWQTQCLL